ncbi:MULTISPECIES: hypothetical protein [Prochlorococcus]|uniref:hypothetical protein n=1 Tax=Prochlorococcus TaxID=1218 RepID=UPI000533B83E|nr:MULTISPECIES: hypothetical protein [Prochlorococcus]KGG13597.1 GNAT family acetyltransferase [Prochlorococcus sp. MIT 0601]
MLPFQNSKTPQIPKGFYLDLKVPPSPNELNKLLSRCYGEAHPPRKLVLALKNSFCNASLKENKTNKLCGFVRVTSDKGLNANLWDLVAEPGHYQKQFFGVLVHQSLLIIRKELPGCSVSLAAPSMAFDALKAQGFLLDPSGIRVMAYRLR